MIKSTSIELLRKRIQNVHPRTRKAQLNTALGLIVKGGAMMISLLLVPMTIDYLSKDTYGTWLTISSIVTMISFLDIGIGNGLRNKFSSAVANHDLKLAKAYVSTSYFIFGLIQLFLIIVFLIFFQFIPWQKVFNTTIETKKLQIVVLLTVVAMSIKLVLDILSYVLLAIQESGKVGVINLMFNILVLTGTFALSRLTKGNIVFLAIITGSCPILILLISSIYLYSNKLRKYRPSWSLVNINHAKSLLSLGYKFFFIQIAVLILFYTDNIIITQLFGPSEVTVYNVAYRYFNAMSVLFSIAITPYWSAFTEASIINDRQWMKSTYNYLQKLWLGLLVAVLIMILAAKPMFSLWVGDRVIIPTALNVVIGISVIIICWNNVTVSVINGLGKVKIQLYCSVFAALINIPLSIYLAQEFKLGSTSVMIATCLSLLPSGILGTIQARKLINGNAHGIWAD